MVGYPRRSGHSGIRRVIRARSEPFDVHRPSDTTGRYGEDSTEWTVVATADLWVQPPRQVTEDTEFGERYSGDMVALGLADANIEERDRVLVGAETYEVEAVEYSPHRDDAELIRITFERVVN
jgi:hypothetical protein